MSDSPYGNTPPGPNPWMPPAGLPQHRPSRAPLIVAIVVALVALTVAIAAWFRPSPTEPPTASQYTDQQITDAKKGLCTAFDTAERATDSAAGLSSDDPNQKFMISINTRLAFGMAANYLLSSVSENSAAPSELTSATHDLAMAYQGIVLAQTASAADEVFKPLYKKGDSATESIRRICK